MSGQFPPQGPWAGYQPFPPPTPKPSRRGIWIVVAVVAAMAVLAGGGFTAWRLLDDSDGTSATDGPSPEPGDPTPTDPTPTVEPTPTEEPTPVSSDPWESIPADAEVSQVADAVETAGYACYDSLAEPVLVRRCFLDPATKSYDTQTVTIQADPDGSIVSVDVDVDYSAGRRKTVPKFEETLRALGGTILSGSEAEAILRGQRPGGETRESLQWGTATLANFRNGQSYKLGLVAKGADPVAIPAGDTNVSVSQVRRHYTGAGFRCEVQPAFNNLLCTRHVRGGVLSVQAFDDCLTAAAKFDSICRGHKVHSFTATAEFDSGMPEDAYSVFFDDFIPPAMDLASQQDDFLVAVDDVLGGGPNFLLKAHQLDVDGLHVQIAPRVAGVVGGFEQSYQVSIDGINVGWSVS